ncbi:tyrosine-type recombinase/integrase [Streptomyces sp. NPDC058252]
MEEASVRRIRLYDARHACLSWMANNGVPDTVVSAWAGHSDLPFTKRVYVHPSVSSCKWCGNDQGRVPAHRVAFIRQFRPIRYRPLHGTATLCDRGGQSVA